VCTAVPVHRLTHTVTAWLLVHLRGGQRLNSPALFQMSRLSRSISTIVTNFWFLQAHDTHACISMTRGLVRFGSSVEPHRLHSATATPFSTGTPLSPVALYTHSQYDRGQAPCHRKQIAMHHHHPSQPRPLFTGHPPQLQQHASHHIRRSWCRCDAQHTTVRWAPW
jgi:hypothetical protein